MTAGRTAYKIARLRTFATVKQGWTFSPRYQGDSTGKWMWAKVSDMMAVGNETLMHTAANYIGDSVLDELRITPFEKGSIIFPRVGAALRTNKKRILAAPGIVDDNLLVITVTDPQACLPSFLFYWFDSISLDRLFANAGLVPSIPPRNVLDAEVPLPSLDEQRSIVAVLSTWDRGIEEAERLLALKEQRKRALMQQLLTGKRRFPESGSDWKVELLCDVADVRVSGVDKKTHTDEVPIRLCNYMDVFYRERIVVDMPFMHATATPQEFKRFQLLSGDVLLTKDSETREDIGMASVVTDNLPGVICGYHLALIRPDARRVDPAFLARQLRHGTTNRHFVRHANGATRYGLTMRDLLHAPVPMPPLEEQQRIAAVLGTCDDEIDQLTAQLDALKQQKKGLMQKLLTGDVRVPVPEYNGDTRS